MLVSMSRVVSGLAAAVALSTALAAQAPAPAGLAGTWKLDQAQSKVATGAGLAGLIGAGAPPMLFVTQPANGTVMIESPINEGHVRMFKPGGKTSTPVGQGGSIAMTSRWDGRTLVSEGTSVNASGVSTPVMESYAVSADGKTLTVTVTTGAAEGKATSTFTYVRITSVGPCESWPTPCKRAPGN